MVRVNIFMQWLLRFLDASLKLIHGPIKVLKPSIILNHQHSILRQRRSIAQTYRKLTKKNNKTPATANTPINLFTSLVIILKYDSFLVYNPSVSWNQRASKFRHEKTDCATHVWAQLSLQVNAH